MPELFQFEQSAFSVHLRNAAEHMPLLHVYPLHSGFNGCCTGMGFVRVLHLLRPGALEEGSADQGLASGQPGVPSIQELRDISIESRAKLVARQMMVDLFNYREEEFIPEISEWIGATSYLAEATDTDNRIFGSVLQLH